MKTYIGVKCVKAQWKCNDKGEAGYLVVYPDGYDSWCPEKVFESAYFPIEQEDRLTPSDIDRFIHMSEVSSRRGDDKTTVVRVEMPTGFVSWAFSSCVSPENYEDAIGTKIALGRVKDKIWELLGFVLQWGTRGLKSEGGIDNEI